MKEQDIIIGTKVFYYPVIPDDSTFPRPKKTIITSKPWKLGHGEVVCKVRGITGCVSIKHLKKRKIEQYRETDSGNALTDAAGAVIDFITDI